MSLFWLQHQAYSASTGAPFGSVVAALSPTAWWRLGDSGSSAVDEQGGQDGTYQGSPTLGVTGYASDDDAVTFANASSQYVDLPDFAGLDLGTGDFSIMFALKRSSWPSSTNEAVLAHGNGFSSGEWVIHTYPYNNTDMEFSYYSGSNQQFRLSMSGLDNDEWRLVGLSFDRSGYCDVYVDGAYVSQVDISSESSTDWTTSADGGIGAVTAPTLAKYWDGSLDEVAIWKGTLLTASDWAAIHAARKGAGSTGGGSNPTQADTYASAVLDLSPDAYYKMHEGAGSTMGDSSMTGNDGSYQGSPTLGVAGPFTGASGATFDGSSQWAQAPYTSALDAGTSDWSCILWVKTSATWTNWRWLIGRYTNYYNAMELFTGQTSDDELASRFTNAAESGTTIANSSTTTNINDDAWHMVGLSADRDGLCTFWLDGAAYGTESISSYQHTLTDSGAVLYLARRGLGNYWAGSLSHVAIWAGYLLTSGDVSDLWTAAGN